MKSNSKKPLSGILHWILVITAPLLLLTGLGINLQAAHGWSLFPKYPDWLAPVRVVFWHRVLAVLFTAVLIPTVVVYLRDWRGKAGQFRKTWFRIGLHVVLLAGGLILVVTGWMTIRETGGADLVPVSRLIHLGAGLCLLGLALIGHLVLAFSKYSRLLGPAFSLTRHWSGAQVLWFVVCLGASSALFLNCLDARMPGKTLVAKRIDPARGPVEELPWEQARAISLTLHNGASFRKGATEMELRAMHDGESIFFQVLWLDSTENRQIMPWKKTADGWEHFLSSLDDESVYYEDKLSLVFPIRKSVLFDAAGCAMACHLGGGRAYGIKSTPVLMDVWHWKAMRSDPCGQLDDQYWDGAGREAKTAGRHFDPSEGGGYERNWKDDEKTGPLFLPGSDDAVKGGGLFRDKAVPRTPELEARIPEGAMVPGLVISPFSGDRGDVETRSRHADGKWTLWIRRPLDTGSEYDAAFRPGETYSFGCAAFDNTSKRHAYNADTYRLRLEP